MTPQYNGCKVGDRVIYTGAYEMLSPEVVGKHGTITKIYTAGRNSDRVADVVFDSFSYKYEDGKHTLFVGNITKATPDWEV